MDRYFIVTLEHSNCKATYSLVTEGNYPRLRDLRNIHPNHETISIVINIIEVNKQDYEDFRS